MTEQVQSNKQHPSHLKNSMSVGNISLIGLVSTWLCAYVWEVSTWFIFGGTVGFHMSWHRRKHESQPQNNTFTALLVFNPGLHRKAHYTVNTVSKSLNYSIHYRMVVEKRLYLAGSGLVALNDSSILLWAVETSCFSACFDRTEQHEYQTWPCTEMGWKEEGPVTWARSLLPTTKILQPLTCY